MSLIDAVNAGFSRVGILIKGKQDKLPTGTAGQFLAHDLTFKTPSGNGVIDSVNGKTGTVTLSASDVGAATSAQGTKADTALQSGDVALVALSGSYNDLTDTPTTMQGEKGDKGDTGAAGLSGIDGNDGAKGDKGDQGIQGEKGEIGLTGAKGDKGDSGGGSITDYSATALASAWTGTNPSVLALTVTGLLATHKTVLDVDLSSVTFANIDGVQADYALIYRAVPTANTLTLYASKKPTKDLSLKLVVLNG